MKRLDCLDGLRGALAMYVLVGHMAPFADLPAWLQSAVSHGGAAVDVFFILSGLVISQSLETLHHQAGPFLIARAARIYPVFLVTFALAVLVQPLSCGFEQMPWVGTDNTARTICVMTGPHSWALEIAAHLTMTHGLFPEAILPDGWVSFLGSAWSLSTEWQFYLLALLLGGRRSWMIGLLLGLATAGMCWRLTMPDIWQFSRAFLGYEGHFFALGVVSLAVVRHEAGARRRYGVTLLASLTICATYGSVGKLLPPLVWTLCLAIQMRPNTRLLHIPYRLLRSAPARYLGAISYCVYLVNEPIHRLIGSALGPLAGGDPLIFDMAWVPLAIGLPLLAAVCLHNWLERPALRWGRNLARMASRPCGWTIAATPGPVQGDSRGL